MFRIGEEPQERRDHRHRESKGQRGRSAVVRTDEDRGARDDTKRGGRLEAARPEGAIQLRLRRQNRDRNDDEPCDPRREERSEDEPAEDQCGDDRDGEIAAGAPRRGRGFFLRI